MVIAMATDVQVPVAYGWHDCYCWIWKQLAIKKPGSDTNNILCPEDEESQCYW